VAGLPHQAGLIYTKVRPVTRIVHLSGSIFNHLDTYTHTHDSVSAGDRTHQAQAVASGAINCHRSTIGIVI
jgi:hypothetical protein